MFRKSDIRCYFYPTNTEGICLLYLAVSVYCWKICITYPQRFIRCAIRLKKPQAIWLTQVQPGKLTVKTSQFTTKC